MRSDKARRLVFFDHVVGQRCRKCPWTLSYARTRVVRGRDGGKLPFKQHRRTAVARPKAYHGVPCRGETRPGVRVGDPCVVPEGGRGRGTDLCARRARAEARTRTLSYAYVQVRHDRWVEFPAECKGHFRASVVRRRLTRPVRISLFYSAGNPAKPWVATCSARSRRRESRGRAESVSRSWDGQRSAPRTNLCAKTCKSLEDLAESASAAHRRAGSRTRRGISPCASEGKTCGGRSTEPRSAPRAITLRVTNASEGL